MPQSNAQLATDATDESQQQSRNRPALTFRHGGLELNVWPNKTENGTMYNTTVSNSYKDEASGEWKKTDSFSQTDLLVLGELSREAFASIAQLKLQGRARS